MSVGLTGGTTTTEVARALAARQDLTVVTNALNIAVELAVRANLKLIVTGGVARSASYELVGPLADATLQGIYVDLAFVGVDGIDAARGLTTQNEVEAATDRALIARAGRTIVVADASKLGRVAFAFIAALEPGRGAAHQLGRRPGPGRAAARGRPARHAGLPVCFAVRVPVPSEVVPRTGACLSPTCRRCGAPGSMLALPRTPRMPRRLDPDKAIGHLDRLYAAARALCGDPHLAEDLVQDTYAAVLSRPRFLSGSDELGYLLRALRNRWRDELRTRQRRPPPAALDEVGEHLAATTPSPDKAMDGATVLDAVHQLDSPYRETLVAIDVLGLSYAEGSDALGVPVGTIMSRLHRGRSKVADRLRDLDLSPAG